MKKLLLALVFGLGILADPLAAADLQPVPFPQKAPAAPPRYSLYPFSGTGSYWGIGTTATSTDASISGQQSALQALGASVGVIAGYRWADSPTTAFAVEGMVFWNNLGAATTCNGGGSCEVSANFTAIERAKAIIPLSTLAAIFPNLPSPPPIQIPGFGAGQNTYAWLGLKEDAISSAVSGFPNFSTWSIAPGFGVGVENQATSGLVLDVWAGYFTPVNGLAFGPGASNVSLGRQYLVGTSLLF